jgi:hypothetical protein
MGLVMVMVWVVCPEVRKKILPQSATALTPWDKVL